MKTNRVLSFVLSLVMLFAVIPLGVTAADDMDAYFSEIESLVGETLEDAALDVSMTAEFQDDGTVSVTLMPESLADGVLPNFFEAYLYYDSEKLELQNKTLSYGAIDCVTKLPSSGWENCTVMSSPGVLQVTVLALDESVITSETPFILAFNFKLIEGFDYSAIYVPTESVLVYDTDFNMHCGNGTSIQIILPASEPEVSDEPSAPDTPEEMTYEEYVAWAESQVGTAESPSFDLVMDAGATENGEVTLTVTPTNILAGVDPIVLYADLYFDEERLELTTATLETGALDCATQVPHQNWLADNLTYYDSRNRYISIGIGDTTYAPVPLSDRSPLVLTFTFKLKDGYDYAAIYAPSESVLGCDSEWNDYFANGSYVIVERGSAAEEPEESTNLALGKDVEHAENIDASISTLWIDTDLTDGVAQSDWFLDWVPGEWQGFWWNENAVDAYKKSNADDGIAIPTIDLGELCTIESARINMFLGSDMGIMPAKSVSLQISADGEIFETVAVKEIVTPNSGNIAVGWVELVPETAVNARYVRLEMVLSGYWLFVDEIEVYGTADDGNKPDVPENKTYEDTLVLGANGNYTCEVPYGYTWNIDYIDGILAGEDATICTTQDAYNACNPNWAITIYAERQADGTYVALKDAITYPGSATNAGITIGENQIAIVVHSAYSNPNPNGLNWLDKVVAMSVKAGDIFVISEDMTSVYAVIPGEDLKPEIIYGDCNGDGEINGRDATALLAYLANYDAGTGVSSEEATDGADCNGDGTIDGRDAVRLLLYLANFDPVTGSSSVELGK